LDAVVHVLYVPASAKVISRSGPWEVSSLK
jgi:hypothetical protein